MLAGAQYEVLWTCRASLRCTEDPVEGLTRCASTRKCSSSGNNTSTHTLTKGERERNDVLNYHYYQLLILL